MREKRREDRPDESRGNEVARSGKRKKEKHRDDPESRENDDAAGRHGKKKPKGAAEEIPELEFKADDNTEAGDKKKKKKHRKADEVVANENFEVAETGGAAEKPIDSEALGDEAVGGKKKHRTKKACDVDEAGSDAEKHSKKKRKKASVEPDQGEGSNEDAAGRHGKKKRKGAADENPELEPEPESGRDDNTKAGDKKKKKKHRRADEVVVTTAGKDGKEKRRKSALTDSEVLAKDEKEEACNVGEAGNDAAKKKRRKAVVDPDQGAGSNNGQNAKTQNSLEAEVVSGSSKDDNKKLGQKKKKKVTFADTADSGNGDKEMRGEFSGKKQGVKNKKVSFGEAVVLNETPSGARPIWKNRQKYPHFGKPYTQKETDTILETIDSVVQNLGLTWTREETYKFLLGKTKEKDYSLTKQFNSAIAACLPERAPKRTQSQARKLMDKSISSKQGKWSEEEVEQLHSLVDQHGKKWKLISELMERTVIDVTNKHKYLTAHKVKGRYSDEDIDKVTNAVHMMLAENVKMGRPIVRRDDISWQAISDIVGRPNSHCRVLWYRDLCSEMEKTGDWATSDDHSMLLRMLESGATDENEVDWDNLLPHRTGATCKKRWNQMRAHLGHKWNWPFEQKLELLVKRYAPCFLEDEVKPCVIQEPHPPHAGVAV